MGMAMPGVFLPQRIRRILEGRPAQRISRVRLVCVVVACASVSAVFTAGAMDHAPAQVARGHALRIPPFNLPKPEVLLALAQATPPSAAGSISGTVEDPSGARVPGGSITLRNQSGDTVASAVASPDGSYRLASVPPGNYNLEFVALGFARRKMDVEIAAGQSARIDARLELGQVSEVLTVTGQKPAAPPAPAAAQPAPKPGPISVGGRVEATRLLTHLAPVYPPELLQQGVEGTVRIRAIISRDGVPVNAHVLNNGEIDPRFAQAALDAVSQWRYQPAKLNGEPVAVMTSIDVAFQLGK